MENSSCQNNFLNTTKMTLEILFLDTKPIRVFVFTIPRNEEYLDEFIENLLIDKPLGHSQWLCLGERIKFSVKILKNSFSKSCDISQLQIKKDVKTSEMNSQNLLEFINYLTDIQNKLSNAVPLELIGNKLKILFKDLFSLLAESYKRLAILTDDEELRFMYGIKALEICEQYLNLYPDNFKLMILACESSLICRNLVESLDYISKLKNYLNYNTEETLREHVTEYIQNFEINFPAVNNAHLINLNYIESCNEFLGIKKSKLDLEKIVI